MKRVSQLLHKYENADFSTKLKANFVFYLCIAAFIGALFIIFFTAFIQIDNPNYNGLNITMILGELLVALLFIFCLLVLLRGNFQVAAHALVIFTLAGIWGIMIIDKGEAIIRLDTIVLIFAALFMLPIIIQNNKYEFFAYFLINIIIFYFYIFQFGGEMDLSFSGKVDALVDTTVAFIFSGIVGYNILRINKLSLQQAENDIRERKIAEDALAVSEKKFREMTEMLPQVVFECTLDGLLTYVNRNAFSLFGYSEEEVSSGVKIYDTIVPADHEKITQNIKSLINGNSNQGNRYLAVKRDGNTFPVMIYANLIKENGLLTGLRGIIIDITEKEKAEFEIKKSYERYQSLVSNIPGATYRCLFDGNWTMIFISSEIYKISGYPASDFIDNSVRSFKSIVYPVESSLISDSKSKAIKNREVWEIEYRIINSENSIRWVYEKGRGIYSENGFIEFLDGFILDITDKKNAEKELKASEEKYRNLMENMNEVVMMVDHKDRIQYVNKKFTEQLGYQPDEVLGKIGYEFLVVPEQHKVVTKSNADRQQNLKGQYELTLIAKNGNLIDFIVSGAPLLDSDGVIIGSIGTLTDITQRKLAEKAHFESEERFKSLLELSPYTIAVNDLDGHYLMVNKAFCSESGYSADEVIGKKAQDLFDAPNGKDVELIDLLNKYGRVDNFETSIKGKDGKLNYIYYSGRIVQMKGQPVILSSTVNITEKKKIEKELEEYRANLEFLVEQRTGELSDANEELQTINNELVIRHQELERALNELHIAQHQLIESEKMASIGILAAGIAHEINNPLNFIKGGITGFEEYFKENLPERINDVAPLVKGINMGVQRASKIVASLNHFSRTNDTVDEKCDLHSIIENCLVILQNRIKHRIVVNRDFSEQLLIIKGNEGKLHQAFLNILTNSYQSIKESGTITISTQSENRNAVICIIDTGSGISNDNLQKIFTPFFTTKEPGEGTGLGLSITYTIIQEHNGKILFSSELEKGTKVTITLPLEGNQ